MIESFSQRIIKMYEIGNFEDLVFVLKYSDVNKQLLDEVEHDIMNYQNRGLCYHRHEVLIIPSHDIMRKPNSIIVLLYIYPYNSSSETEAKRSAILFLGRTLQGA